MLDYLLAMKFLQRALLAFMVIGGTFSGYPPTPLLAAQETSRVVKNGKTSRIRKVDEGKEIVP